MKFTSGGPCDHCDRTSSPCWRKGPPEKPTLCNACGSRYLVKKSLDGYMPQAFPAGGAVQALQREAQQRQQQRALQLLDLPSDGRARQKRTQLPSSQQRAKQRKLDQDPFPDNLSGPSAMDNPAESDLHRRRMRYFFLLQRPELSSCQSERTLPALASQHTQAHRAAKPRRAMCNTTHVTMALFSLD